MKRICPCFTPSRIVLAESTRESFSSVARYAFNLFFFLSSKRLYDFHIILFYRFLHRKGRLSEETEDPGAKVSSVMAFIE